MNKILQYVIHIILALIFLGIVTTALLLMSYDYSTFTDSILTQFGKPHLKATFQQILPEKKYIFIQYSLWAIVFLYSLLMVFLISKSAIIAQKITHIFQKISKWSHAQFKEIQALSKLEKLLLGSIIGASAAINLYQICHLDLIYDEIWTFLYFTRHAPIMAIATYPAPNNHVLFSLISSMLYQIGVSDLWALRLPVFLFSILCNIFFWLFIKEYFNRTAAFTGLSFFAFCLPMSFYGVYGRGYILLIFFTIISLWALLKWVTQPDNKMPILVFVIACVAGFYSIPTFLYIYILWTVFALLKKVFFLSNTGVQLKTAFIIKFIKVSFIIAVLVILLYSPILMVYGLGHSFSNMSQFKIEGIGLLLQQFPTYLKRVFDFFGGRSLIGVILWTSALIGGGLMWWQSKDIYQKYIGGISSIGLLFPVLFYFIQQSQIPARVWSFDVVFISLMLGNILVRGIRYLGGIRYLLIIFIASISIYFTHTNAFWKNIKHNSTADAQLSKFIVEQDANTCFLNYYILKPSLEYERFKQEKSLKIYMAQPSSVDYYNLKSSDKMDILVIGKNARYAEPLEMEAAFFKNYKIAYENEFVQVFQWNN